MTADAPTFYAKWNINSYEVSFNANGGSGSMDEQTIVYGAVTEKTAMIFPLTTNFSIHRKKIFNGLILIAA